MNADHINTFFTHEIYPSFPFTDNSWVGMEFNSGSYDALFHKKFFMDINLCFFQNRNESTFIMFLKYECGELYNTVMKVSFDWNSYNEFFSAQSNYAPSYKIVSEDESFAIWSDEEITVICGNNNKMHEVYQIYGGEDGVISYMEREILGGTPEKYPEDALYIKSLVYPKYRKALFNK